MNSPKFKKGDLVIRNNNKPDASFESIRGCNNIRIRKVEKLSMVYFYGVDKSNFLNDDILFPQTDFDSMYDLDIPFIRKIKINKIIKKIS